MARLSYVARGEVARVPWSAALVLAAAGVALIFTAIRTRHRLEGKPGTKRLPPLVGARLAALGRRCLAGRCRGRRRLCGLRALPARRPSTDYRKEVALRCGLCVLGAVVVVVGALLLERVLRLPEDIDEAHLPT